MMKCIFSIVAAVATLAAVAEDAERPFAPYQSIVDRQMFGPVPDGFDPTKPPSEVRKGLSSQEEKELAQQEEKLKSAVRFSVINVTESGETAVGFTDNSDPKTPKHHYLKVGESADGWTVKEADAAAASMTIEKDGIEISLTIGGDSSKDDKATKKAGESRRNTAANTLRGRRKQREEEMRKREEDVRRREEQAKAAEAKQEEDRANREAELNDQRTQLMAIQEELKKQREAREAEKKEESAADEAKEESAE